MTGQQIQTTNKKAPQLIDFFFLRKAVQLVLVFVILEGSHTKVLSTRMSSETLNRL